MSGGTGAGEGKHRRVVASDKDFSALLKGAAGKRYSRSIWSESEYRQSLSDDERAVVDEVGREAARYVLERLARDQLTRKRFLYRGKRFSLCVNYSRMELAVFVYPPWLPIVTARLLAVVG